jgi:1,4-alpha-glucan branching enzyme
MGATLTPHGCRFRTWAPNAVRVAVMGSFNDWRDAEFQLAPLADGVWEVVVPGVRAGDEYLYVIDNRGGDAWNPGQLGLRRIDPWARATRGSSGNAVVVDVAAELEASGLTADSFTTPAPADWLIYQAHVGSFAGLGDGIDTGPTTTATFVQVEQKLAHIRRLGFNALALLPVHQNPGDGNEGYGPSHLFAPDSSYGSPAELRHLIRCAHDAGLAVLFDVVWNHMSDVDNRLWEFDGMTREGGIFFEASERSPWGPRLALWKREVRDLIVAQAAMCFAEYHVDGLRVDATEEIPQEVLAEVVRAVRAEPYWHHKFLIAEWAAGGPVDRQHLVDEVGFDRVWAVGDPPIFFAAVDERRSGTPALRVRRLEELLGLPDGGVRIRYMLGSHDSVHDNESGARDGFRHFVERVGGRDDARARAKARMGWALSIALPGTPMCFMGTECLQPGYWHPRPDDNPLHGDHRFDWAACTDPIGREMQRFVAAANDCWWDHPVLRHGDLMVVHVNRPDGVIAFRRDGADGASVLAVVNASSTTWSDDRYHLPLPAPMLEWQVILDSTTAGPPPAAPLTHRATEDGVLTLSIPAWSVVLLAGS